jgi:hypothetical protein
VAQNGDPANGDTGTSAPLVITEKVLVGTPVGSRFYDGI